MTGVGRPTPGSLRTLTRHPNGHPTAGKGRLTSLSLALSKRHQPKLSRIARRPLTCHGYPPTYAAEATGGER